VSSVTAWQTAMTTWQRELSLDSGDSVSRQPWQRDNVTAWCSVNRQQLTAWQAWQRGNDIVTAWQRDSVTAWQRDSVTDSNEQRDAYDNNDSSDGNDNDSVSIAK
jgi:hypothetical protein